MSKRLLERMGLVAPKTDLRGTVRRIGFVCTGSESAGYYAIQFEDHDLVHKVFAVREVAETLALTLPGENLALTVKEGTNSSQCIRASRT
jgi:hypothetical protein